MYWLETGYVGIIRDLYPLQDDGESRERAHAKAARRARARGREGSTAGPGAAGAGRSQTTLFDRFMNTRLPEHHLARRASF